VIQLPRIDVIFQNDSCKILLDLFVKELHKHGYKDQLNWGSLRETYAAALIYESQLLEKFDKTNQLLVWDPFCGSGTILIELFLIALNQPVRQIDNIFKEGFTHLPFHDETLFNKFVTHHMNIRKNKEINFKSEDNNFDIQFISSDINSKSLSAFINNSAKISLESYIVKNNNQTLHQDKETMITYDFKNINPNIYHHKVNNIFNAFIGDYEMIGKEIVFNDKVDVFKNRKFDIFSNIPYGRSHEMSDKIQIKTLYRRFGKFLRKYTDQIGDVFILVNKRHKEDELNFKTLTEMNWELIKNFDNNGIEVEFLKMNKKIRSSDSDRNGNRNKDIIRQKRELIALNKNI
jgi:23S rRNA G2445 N2-methylase RlmL